MTYLASNNKQIAKNTLLLYFRMLLTMLITLYTSRIILNALGIEDYGIYNVTGGIVSMLSIFSGTISNAISRFLSFEIAHNNKNELIKIFSTSLNILILISILCIIIAETTGLWFINNKLNIPIGRLNAAHWVLQSAIIAFIINLINVPYNSVIIAHEKMSIFATISIIDVILKLIIAYSINMIPKDPLVTYSILLILQSFIIRFCYFIYCTNKFQECHYVFSINKELIQKISNYIGWTFIGAISFVMKGQGINILLNIFCGPVINAARGISYQVNNAIYGFSSNFMTALTPQITKSYASQDFKRMEELICYGSKFSSFLLLIISMPVICFTNYVLHLWLLTVPQYTESFVKLILISSIIEALALPLHYGIQATGKIKQYQLALSAIQIANFPISYYYLYKGSEPETTIIIAIILSILGLGARLYFLQRLCNFSLITYWNKVLRPMCLIITFCTITYNISSFSNIKTFSTFLISSIFMICINIIFLYFIGCSKQERLTINQYIKII